MHPFSLGIGLVPAIVVLLFVGAALHVVPDLTRPEIFFGVTIDPEFRRSELGRAIRRRYRRAIWIATLAAAAIAAVARAPVIAWVLQGVVGVWTIARAHRAALAHAVLRSTVVEVELSSPGGTPAGTVALLSLPIASLAMLGAWAAVHSESLPARLPVHWSFVGADRWVTTSPGSVAALLALYALVCLLLALIAWGVLHGSRRIAMGGEAARAEQRFRTRSVRLLAVVET